MRGEFGDVSYSVDDGHLILHTYAGGVMICPEVIEELADVIQQEIEHEGE